MSSGSDSGEIRLAIVGSRNLLNKAWFETKMKEVVRKWGMPDCVVSGGARGADSLGEKWASDKVIKTKIYKPDWKTHGKRAGIIRNGDIVEASTHMVAFPSKNGKGTQDSIRRAQKKNLKILVFQID